MVIIGHRKWKIRPIPKDRWVRKNGLCDYERATLWVRFQGQTAPQQANTLLHEMEHAIWDEAGLNSDDEEERIVTATTNVRVQVIRDNPKVMDWIAEKART